jgi:hypothetical protein
MDEHKDQPILLPNFSALHVIMGVMGMNKKKTITTKKKY